MPTGTRVKQFSLVSDVGVHLDFSLTDKLLVDDLVVSMGQAEGFRRRTGKKIGPDLPERQVRDYLIKLGVVFP